MLTIPEVLPEELSDRHELQSTWFSAQLALQVLEDGLLQWTTFITCLCFMQYA